MDRFEHTRLVDQLAAMDVAPGDPTEYATWITGDTHLDFLRRNAAEGELVVYGSGECAFIHAVVVPNERLEVVDQHDLLRWSFNPFKPIASFVTGGGSDDVWVERGLQGTSTDTLDGAVQLVFGRTFEGWSDPDRTYFEVNQEYTHLSGIHWRHECRAYCRFDENGDLSPIVSVTGRGDGGSRLALVSFNWHALEEYLTASDSSLVRMFDFTLLQSRSAFAGWGDEQPETVHESPGLFYRRRVLPARAGYTRGVQVIRTRGARSTIAKSMRDAWFGDRDKRYVEFMAYDWRNGRDAVISTDPAATTNYFDAANNCLPFELSPAFFRPEVLSKYKADRDKYRVSSREVSCRSAWHLQSIDVNEANQVHAYICYLRSLPYEEQLHWRSFNVVRKAGLSERAIANDFEGRFLSVSRPLEEVLAVVRRWSTADFNWWTLRSEQLLDRVNTPLTASRDEWAEAFMSLAKLVVEGFELKAIRERLDAANIGYGKDDKSITLLEALINKGAAQQDGDRLIALRTVQRVRTTAKGHFGGNEAIQLSREALRDHGTYGGHFESVCRQLLDELLRVERALV